VAAKSSRESEPKTTDVLLPLVAALWGCATLVFNVTKELNIMRDKIIFGAHAVPPIPLSHRRLILESDWCPQVGFIILAGLGFAALAWSAPQLISATTPGRGVLLRVSRGIALLAGAGALAWLLSAVVELRTMRAALRIDEAAAASAPAAPQ